MARVFRRDGAWWVDFKDGEGRRRRFKAAPTRRIAKEVLDGYLGKVARQEHLGVIDDSAIAFSDFAAIWLERVEPGLKERSRERWRGIVDQHLKPAFPSALRSVTAAGAAAYVAARTAERACDRCEGERSPEPAAPCSKCEGSGKMPGAQASTVNREMTVLKHMMRKAVAWKYLGRNPFLDNQGRLLAELKPLREPPGRVRFLTLDEVDRLIAACADKPYLKAFTLLALNSGMRRNEILSLRLSSIDWQNRIANLETTKNGEPGHVPLNDAALEALRALPAPLKNAPLFPFTPNQVSVAFMRAARRAGIENFRLHDCRHTFASYQAMAGTQGRGLQAMLRHKDPRMTARYSHLSDTYLAQAVNAVQLGAGTRPTILSSARGAQGA